MALTDSTTARTVTRERTPPKLSTLLAHIDNIAALVDDIRPYPEIIEQAASQMRDECGICPVVLVQETLFQNGKTTASYENAIRNELLSYEFVEKHVDQHNKRFGGDADFMLIWNVWNLIDERKGCPFRLYDAYPMWSTYPDQWSWDDGVMMSDETKEELIGWLENWKNKAKLVCDADELSPQQNDLAKVDKETHALVMLAANPSVLKKDIAEAVGVDVRTLGRWTKFATAWKAAHAKPERTKSMAKASEL